MATIDIDTAWTHLSEAQQLVEWRSFLSSLDAGDAGYHRWYPVLMPLWDRGEVPPAVETEVLAAYETEMGEQAAWEARNGADAWLHGYDLAEDAETLLWSRFDPDAADRVLGNPPF
jgi:hypothetical protein